jgi:hypothetical protein
MMPSIEISDRLYSQLDEKAEDKDIERVVWQGLSEIRESQDSV